MDSNSPAHIERLCSEIRARYEEELQSRNGSEERNALLGTALYDYADAVFPALSVLSAASGSDTTDYHSAQTAALDLLTWISIPFVRTCSNHSVAIKIFGEIEAKCTDDRIRQKLVTYTNQAKSHWSQVESGGILYNPRAAKRYTREQQNSWWSWLVLVACIAVVGAVIVNLDLVKVLFGKGQEELAQQAVRHEKADYAINAEQIQPEPADPSLVRENPPPAPPMPETGIYKFTDKNGVINIVDSAHKVPPQYRSKVTVVQEKNSTTAVRIVGNQVLVPVTLQHNGRVVQTLLLLDTGCSNTVISEDVAARLGIDWSDSKSVTARVADGRSVGAQRVRVDRLSVGSRGEAPCDVDVMGHVGPRESHEGLLGMNFLREHQYRLDLKRSVIVWM